VVFHTREGHRLKVLKKRAHARERREMHTTFWLENLKEGDQSEDLGVDEKVILELILGK
jgi:hypothetical protein